MNVLAPDGAKGGIMMTVIIAFAFLAVFALHPAFAEERKEQIAICTRGLAYPTEGLTLSFRTFKKMGMVLGGVFK